MEKLGGAQKKALVAVGAVLAAGVLTLGIVSVVNAQQDRERTATCIVSGDC